MRRVRDYNDYTFVPNIGHLSHRQFDQWFSHRLTSLDEPVRGCVLQETADVCPAPVAWAKTASGRDVYLCPAHLDAWLDEADNAGAEPSTFVWLKGRSE